MNIVHVNVYDYGRAYGGPEEGGWWFDTGTPIASIPVEFTEDEWLNVREAFGGAEAAERNPDAWSEFLRQELLAKALEEADRWEKRYPPTGNSSSVLGGKDYRVLIEDHFARPFPEERPRYE